MKLKKAVLKSLKELNCPATYKMVYLHILENDYYDFSNTKTPDFSVSAALGNLYREQDFRIKRIYKGNNTFLYIYQD